MGRHGASVQDSTHAQNVPGIGACSRTLRDAASGRRRCGRLSTGVQVHQSRAWSCLVWRHAPQLRSRRRP
eukprot:10116134-Lingulodinium_polyedra.AAC.1